MVMKTNSPDSAWEMSLADGFADMLEETPQINPEQPTHFSKVVDIDGVRLYLNRPTPSWIHSRRMAA